MMSAIAVMLAACISNDLPYPWVMPSVDAVDVVSVDAEGHELLQGKVEIDSVSRSIVINLTEWADIRKVEVRDVKFAEGTVCLNPEIFNAPLDLTSPVTMRLERYDRVFEWTISATQTITRYFTVASQIGTSEIDVENHTVTAWVPTAQPIGSIRVKTIKLAGPSSVITPDLVGRTVDFSEPVKVTVSEFGSDQEWTISVHQTDVSVNLDRIDAWTNVAWLYASAEEGKANGFQYRQASSEDWIDVPSDWITHDGGSFCARLVHLDSQTAYVARAISDTDHSAEMEFTTGENVQLPNSTFENWWLDNKVWCPWATDSEPFWGTGNKGAATLGQSNVVPVEDSSSPTGYRGIKMETKFVGISILGKIAAGNLFAGDFVKVVGTNGILSFGRPFVMRPTKVKVRLKYTTADITDVSKSNPDFTAMKGQPDTCIVWGALIDSEQPFEIRTSPSDRQLFNPAHESVIAYGQFQSGSDVSQLTDVEVELDYKSTDRVPTYLLITASASKYGDYFTGGRGATLWIDSITLLYDY